jgi:stage II sporulation protein D
LCGAIIWAVLPIGVAILNSDGASFKGDFKPYPIKASKVSSAVEKQEKSNKYSNFYSASSSKTQQASLTSLPVDWQKFSGHMQIRLLDHKTKQLCHLDLEEYIVGVVAAEMPASFDIEALKAQAVAARTYAVRRVVQGASPQVLAQNQQAQISSDHNINQAWIDEKERENRWGNNFPGNEAKIRQAVGQTQGIILLYKGQIIDPLYHASCGGERTEDVSNVWSGQSVPYLQSMKCSGHQDKHQNNQTMLDLITVDAKLGTTLNELPAASLFGKRSEDVCQIVDKTKTGRVMSASIMGKSYSGSELRTKLELPSTKFEMDFKDGQLEITNQGYGHGVGMCQYGAADFAAKGESWQKILLHYYKDVQPARITIKQ